MPTSHTAPVTRVTGTKDTVTKATETKDMATRVTETKDTATRVTGARDTAEHHIRLLITTRATIAAIRAAMAATKATEVDTMATTRMVSDGQKTPLFRSAKKLQKTRYICFLLPLLGLFPSSGVAGMILKRILPLCPVQYFLPL